MKTPTHDELRMLEERIAQLETENAHLRHSAKAFGDLAERLNAQLRKRDKKTNGRVPHDELRDNLGLELKPR